MIIIRGLNKAFGDKIIFSNFNLEIPDGRANSEMFVNCRIGSLEKKYAH